eukprot:3878306-Rhodomonas_salina.1
MRLGGGLNPIILIGNYFFDSIRADVFRSGGGIMQEGLISNHFSCKNVKTAEQSIADVNPFDKKVMKHLKEDLNYTSIDSSQRYSGRDADLADLLQWYQSASADPTGLFLNSNPLPPFGPRPADSNWATFLISAPAFRIFRELFAAYPGGVLCIAADSGVQDPVYFRQPFEHDEVTLANKKGGESGCVFRVLHFSVAKHVLTCV